LIENNEQSIDDDADDDDNDDDDDDDSNDDNTVTSQLYGVLMHPTKIYCFYICFKNKVAMSIYLPLAWQFFQLPVAVLSIVLQILIYKKTHCISITNTNQLMLCKEATAAYLENHMIHKYTVWAERKVL
jgi:hypothetical protein